MNFTEIYFKSMDALEKVDWDDVNTRVDKGIRLVETVTQSLAMVIVLLAEVTWEHRQQIRDGVVAAIAATVVTVKEVYRAGKATRAWVERMSDASADLIKEMPDLAAPVAPIAAPIAAVGRSATTALLDWLGFASEGAMIQKRPTFEELMALPAATLREMVGTRSRYPKAKLVAMLMAA